jgi:hypothetical protein
LSGTGFRSRIRGLIAEDIVKLLLFSFRLACLACLLVPRLLPAARPAPAVSFAEGDEKDALTDMISELHVEKGSTWWNADWSFRRSVTVHDPRLGMGVQDVFLTDPDPLLLANTRPCARALADLRAVSLKGEIIPCGVSRFGQDDGLSLIWIRPDPSARPPFVFFLYYGNGRVPPAATPEPARIPEERDRMTPVLGPEETAPGYRVPATTGPSFFTNMVVLEAESCMTDYGKPSFTYDRQPPQMAWVIRGRDDDETFKTASGGAYLASTCPWRQQAIPEPILASNTVVVPEAGLWQAWVRYRVTRYHPLADKAKGGLPTAEQYVPFEVALGGKTFTCGTNQAPGAIYRWDRFEVELPAGELEARFRLAGFSAPDCLLLTRDAAYRPDRRDFNGPVWMRFRVPDASFGPYIAELFCVITPWSSHGPQGESAGYLFRDQVVKGDTDVAMLKRDPAAYLQPGAWSPWIRALHSTAITWWSTARFFAQGKTYGNGGAPNLAVDFEFATRPDAERVFRRGTETWESTPGLSVLMPQELAWAEVNRRTLSFSQWARQRFAFVQGHGVSASEGPRDILVTTMSTSVNAEESDYIVRTCGLLGFNGLEMRTPLSREAFAQLAAKHGMTWSTAHHWAPKFALEQMPDRPAEGQSCQAALKAFLEEQCRGCYAPGPRWGSDAMPVRLLIMGDEIGPATMASFINVHPLLKGAFHEYLEGQGLAPDFFGKTNWSDVAAFSYHPMRKGSEAGDALVAYRKARGLPPDPDLEEAQPALPDTLALPGGGAEVDDLVAAEEQRQADLRLARPVAPGAALEEKRLYHWTQRFRSHYTTVFYGTAHAEIMRRSAEMGRAPPYANPNFQAMPEMCGQMWDGALNLFEWARSGTTEFLFMEDWIGDPYRVAFGQRLLAAAARKKGQNQGALIVADRAPRQRYLMSLANGGRVFLSYLYGPLRVIGPAWAESELTIRAWADSLAWTGRFEKELLGAAARPAEAALLIANTSEINSPFLSTSLAPSRPLNERQNLFAALLDAGVPVELVGEEEIIEDGALSRYKALYVTDPHVDSRAQERIKEWVKAGGVLWASHAGLMREEYDVATTRFDEVFGLASRGAPVEPDRTAGGLSVTNRIRTTGNGALPEVAFDAYPIRPSWKTAGADVLAVYADTGAPALIRHGFGKGSAFLFANSTLAVSGGAYGPDAPDQDWAAGARRLVALGATSAGVAPHVTLSSARVLWTVLDGTDYTMLVLANCRAGAVGNLGVEIVLPRRPKEVVSGRGSAVPFDWAEGRARLTLTLGKDDGEILLFR